MRRLLTLAAFAAACGSGTAACPTDLPTTCPSPMPSFSGGVGSIIASQCATCHEPNGAAASWPLTSYQEVFNQRQEVLSQVYSCLMPPEDSAQPTDSQRQALVGWLSCGAPNN
jgi:uncharacterized membrane protein